MPAGPTDGDGGEDEGGAHAAPRVFTAKQAASNPLAVPTAGSAAGGIGIGAGSPRFLHRPTARAAHRHQPGAALSPHALLTTPLAAVSAPAFGLSSSHGMEQCAACHKLWNPERLVGVRCSKCHRPFHAPCAGFDVGQVRPEMYFLCVRCNQETPATDFADAFKEHKRKRLKMLGEAGSDGNSDETESEAGASDAMFTMDDFTEEETAAAAALAQVAKAAQRSPFGPPHLLGVQGPPDDCDLEAIRTLGMLKLSSSVPSPAAMAGRPKPRAFSPSCITRPRPRSRNRGAAPSAGVAIPSKRRSRSQSMPGSEARVAAETLRAAASGGSETRQRSSSNATGLRKVAAAAAALSDTNGGGGGGGGGGSKGDGGDHKRMFHNERERQRRSTIRSLFDSLRKAVPSLEAVEGTSDRQILLEAAKFITDLNVEGTALEATVRLLREENARLRTEHGLPVLPFPPDEPDMELDEATPTDAAAAPTEATSPVKIEVQEPSDTPMLAAPDAHMMDSSQSSPDPNAAPSAPGPRPHHRIKSSPVPPDAAPLARPTSATRPPRAQRRGDTRRALANANDC